jgi:Ca2+-binding EF-hand superfamily protein
MGNSGGTFTAKATISPSLYPFSKWGPKEIQSFLVRGQSDLSETFGLRKHEFEFLVGSNVNEEISFKLVRSLFEDIFDTDKNGLVDKFEAMCSIAMVSKLATQDKIHFFFDLFNFNNKGFLNESELTLLIMALTRGIFKIDQHFLPLEMKTVKSLVTEAFSSYAKDNPAALRKPELVRFVGNNADIIAYLECWRGHASQVLLMEGMKWKDLSFLCNEASITPNSSSSWKELGLPPSNFIHWRRRDRIGISDLGADLLFAHEVSFLKTIDRRLIYTGEGAMSKGYLKQGCLADLWFLNGLSALISRPQLASACFGETGQEADGRYCCRFFEGGSWRSVYVDDRLPCGPNCFPLFASSSCQYEAWILVLEKAVAKYLGSYGHIAWCSNRSDSSLMSLRMLTGGHILRYYILNYDWKSIIEESVKESGVRMILNCLKEGTIVCLVRSASQSMMSLTMKQNKAAFNLPPVGHFFPVVGSCYEQGYLYFILKDTWGLIGDADYEVNFDTGRCGTFKIKVEDVPFLYDCIVLSRFPDSIRKKAEELKIPSWITEVATTSNPSSSEPAMFLLTVEKEEKKKAKGGGMNNDRKASRLMKPIEKINKVLNESNRVSIGDDNESNLDIPRLKEREGFGRLEKFQVAASSCGKDKSTPPIVNMFQQVDLTEDLINVCFSVSR